MAAAARIAVEGRENTAESMPYAAALARFAGDWLLLQIVSYDATGQPGEVRVLARAADERAVQEALIARGPTRRERTGPYQVVQALRYISTGADMRRELADLAERRGTDAKLEAHGGPGPTRWR